MVSRSATSMLGSGVGDQNKENFGLSSGAPSLVGDKGGRSLLEVQAGAGTAHSRQKGSWILGRLEGVAWRRV
jgi:hypothetical protein